MANITLKNVPDPLYEKLKQQADAHRRSITQEAIVCLERALGEESTDRDQLLEEIDRVRERTENYHLTDEELDDAIDTGRP
jgi:plasmid stability protein